MGLPALGELPAVFTAPPGSGGAPGWALYLSAVVCSAHGDEEAEVQRGPRWCLLPARDHGILLLEQLMEGGGRGVVQEQGGMLKYGQDGRGWVS